jgi:hypothetical protein
MEITIYCQVDNSRIYIRVLNISMIVYTIDVSSTENVPQFRFAEITVGTYFGTIPSFILAIDVAQNAAIGVVRTPLRDQKGEFEDTNYAVLEALYAPEELAELGIKFGVDPVYVPLEKPTTLQELQERANHEQTPLTNFDALQGLPEEMKVDYQNFMVVYQSQPRNMSIRTSFDSTSLDKS